ncbi:MAG: VanZ family protein [Ignavibacteria bacterium]|nr:VanZ family protein [Ignavibacteria bacterium]
MKHFLLNQWLGIIWGLIILLLTGLPGTYFPTVTTFWDWASPDKIVHLFIFGVFTFLVLYGNRTQYFGSKKRFTIVLAALTGIAYGGITELLQYYLFVGRDGNIFDFLANVAGCFSGIGIFMLFFRKKVKN